MIVFEILADLTYPVWTGLCVLWMFLVLLTMGPERWRYWLAAALFGAACAFGILTLSTGRLHIWEFAQARPWLRVAFSLSAVFFVPYTLRYVSTSLQWDPAGLRAFWMDTVRKLWRIDVGGLHRDGNGT